MAHGQWAVFCDLLGGADALECAQGLVSLREYLHGWLCCGCVLHRLMQVLLPLLGQAKQMQAAAAEMLIVQTPGSFYRAVVLDKARSSCKHWPQKRLVGRAVERSGPPAILGALTQESDQKTEFQYLGY